MSGQHEVKENSEEMPDHSVVMELEQDIDEELVLSNPWALRLMKTIKRISKESVLNWCNRVIILGEDTVDVVEWTSIFASHVEKAFQELIADIWNLQQKAETHIQELKKTLEELSRELHVEMPVIGQNKNLYEEQRCLVKTIEEYQMKVDVRRKELRELRDKQIELCKALEKEPIILEEYPLPTPEQLNGFYKYIESLEKEKLVREKKYMQLKNEIVGMVNELRIEATLDFEKELLSQNSTDFPVTKTNMKQLENYHQKLSDYLRSVKEEISLLRNKIENLWSVLDLDKGEQESFRQQHTNNSLETLEAFKCEYKRLQDLKKANIKLLIEKRREQLSLLWEQCHCDGSQKNDLHFINSEVYSEEYSEDLLELYDREVEKWNNYYEQNMGLIKMIEEHRSLWFQLLELEHSAESVNRYKNRGGQLLLEEKARNKLSKKIPDLEQQMKNLAMKSFMTHGYPFRTFGKTVEDHIQDLHDRREEEKRLKLSSKKQQRGNAATPSKSCSSVLPCVSNVVMRDTPVSSKTVITPITSGKKKLLKESNLNKMSLKSPRRPAIKMPIVCPVRRVSAERRHKIEAYRNHLRNQPLRVNQEVDSEDSRENCGNTTFTKYDTSQDQNLSK